MSMHESRAKALRRRITREGTKQAGELKKAGRAETDAARKANATGSTTSANLQKSRSRDAARKNDKAIKARQRAGTAAGTMTEAQKKLHEVESTMRAEQDRDAKRRRQKAEREQQRAEAIRQRADRERERQDQARDTKLRVLHSQVADQERRLREAALAPVEITVLFIAASPEDQEPLRLDREVREIQRRVRESEYRDSVRFEVRLASQVTDLLQALNELRPHVVHFSGHGSQAALAFEDDDGHTKPLSNVDLAMLLRASSERIRLAVFNTCQSADQAQLATGHIDAAIGMDESVADESAKTFSGQFYNSLGFGLSLAQAFEQACAYVKLATGTTSGEPRLYVASGVAPDEVYLVAPASG